MVLMATIQSLEGAQTRDAMHRRVELADLTGSTLPVVRMGPDTVILQAGYGFRIELPWDQVACHYAESATEQIRRRCEEAEDNPLTPTLTPT
jgi:hypothetical protein